MTVAVVTDSAASLPPALAAEHGIAVVPLVLQLGGQAYDDGDIPLDEVLARLGEGASTSGPSPGRLAAAMQERLEDADDVLVLTIADTMSSTFEAAQVGARTLGDRVRVVDTATAAGAQGLVVIAAADAAARGADLDEVVAVAEQAIDRVRLVATVPSLDRLAASGRVPGIAGWAGAKIGINPMFRFRDGQARPMRPALSRAAALERIVSTWQGSRPADGSEARLHVAALHAQADDEARALLDQVEAAVAPATSFLGEFSPVMVVHTGPGLVGLAWWWELPPRSEIA